MVAPQDNLGVAGGKTTNVRNRSSNAPGEQARQKLSVDQTQYVFARDRTVQAAVQAVATIVAQDSILIFAAFDDLLL